MNCRGLKSAVALSADKPHGTRMKYLGGCKCLPCRAANSSYETERSAARKAGDWNGIVCAKVARKHLLKLSKQGVGRRAVAAASDVAASIIAEIRTGRRLKIRQRTERRILAVTKEAYSAHALIDADPTWRRIEKLLEEGFTKAELARRLGYKSRAIQIKRFEVTAATAMRVEQFYSRIMAGGDE